MVIRTIYGATVQSCSGALVWLIIILVIISSELYRLVPLLFTPVQQFHSTCLCTFTPVQLCTSLIFWKILLRCKN